MSDEDDTVLVSSGSDSSGVLIEAPASTKKKNRRKGKSSDRRGEDVDDAVVTAETGSVPPSSAASGPPSVRASDGTVRVFTGGYRTSFGPSDPTLGVRGLHLPPPHGERPGRNAGLAVLGGREDCCAYVCCGTLLSSRTKHQLKYALRAHRRDGYTTIDTSILADEIESADRRRKAVYFSLFVAFVAGLIVCIWTVPMDANAYNDKISNADDDVYGSEDPPTFVEYQLSILSRSMSVVAAIYSAITAIVCIRGRMATRRALEAIIPTTKDDGVDDADHVRMLHANTTAVCAHAPCGCYPVDYSRAGLESVLPATETPEGYVTMSMARDVGSGAGGENADADVRHDDYCSSCLRCIMGCMSGLACLSSHWIQCCGICAVAQEAREVRALVPPEMQYIDFLTFEPFTSYKSKFNDLIKRGESGMATHIRSSSVLAKYILYGNIFVCFMVLAISLLLDRAVFGIENALVVCGTVLQGVFVLLFVHWTWKRFDLSIDAVIKLFAAGFYLCAPLALVFEFILVGALDATKFAISTLLEYKQIVFVLDDFILLGYPLTMFVNLLISAFKAFVVAAMVEEIAKYFCFFMVQHPDLMVDPSEKKTMQSKSAAITIAMVAVSVGFAVFEDFLYITKNGSVDDAWAGLIVLGLRTLLPIHPLCAAIQSIGVCRRDLEGERGMLIGWIIFPAVLLHGLYDFVLMSSDIVAANFANVAAEQYDIDEDQAEYYAGIISLGGMIGAIGVFVIGLISYFVTANMQAARIAELDQKSSYKTKYEMA